VPRATNPYRPGFSQVPEHLAGRAEILDSFDEALEIAGDDGRTPAPLVLVGDRGVGKSVLLVTFRQLAAEARGWPTVHVEATTATALHVDLAHQLAGAAGVIDEMPDRRWQTERFTVRSGLPFVGGEMTVARTDPVAGTDLDAALTTIVEAVTHKGSGLVVTIDEVHVAGSEPLGAVAAALQRHVPDDWPLVVVLAGLTALRRPGKSVTYLERCDWHELGMLGQRDTLAALTVPAEAAGRSWEADAAAQVAEHSGGYPFAIQMYGYHTWRASAGAEHIDTAAAATGLAVGDRKLAAGLYRNRWDAAPDGERSYLAAAARLVVDSSDGHTTGAQIAAALARPAQALSETRARCLERGNLVASGRRLRFPVPGMATWIVGHLDDLT
jgi:hypothetical protein